jgi:class 3 adenylate cyclase
MTMAIQPTFLLIADIAGYTRFMKFHRASLAHAQEIIAQLLEAVIDATRQHLKLAKLEGDAAFFFLAYPPGKEADLGFVAEQSAAIYRAFHERASDLKVNTLCVCDGCQQAGDLKIKLVGHFGEAAIQKVKSLVELAGVDVILVHRLLKNAVPIPEYLLMTEPVHQRVDGAVRERAAALRVELDDLGPTATYYMDLERYVGEVPPAPKLSYVARLLRHARLTQKSLPAMLGFAEACRDFRNVDRTPPGAAGERR